MEPSDKEQAAGLNTETAQFTTSRFADGMSIYMSEAESLQVLHPHQLDVFHDLKTFFEEKRTRGFVNLPTGTGKTVLFVELTKALRETQREDGQKPKILVVAPTKDLVYQTMGRSGERGYGRFAPDLRVGSYFSDSTSKEKEDVWDYDVVVTTYRSFEIMSHTQKTRPIEDFDKDVLESEHFKEFVKKFGYDFAYDIVKEWKSVPTGQTLLDNFDVFILDEAHHTLGASTGSLVSSLPKEKLVIGFTATPDADELRQLSNYLPSKIHELELNEAISLGLLAPLAPIGVKSGIRIQGSDIYDESGEFIDSRIKYIAEDPGRNKIIVEVAKTLANEGIGTLISCIAGSDTWHARYLAELLQENGVRAIAVHSKISAEQRQKIYQDFNDGNIDVITFIGVLGEGWDSQRAKGLINARPTRSPIFAKQRLGRITRSGGVAFAIDIYDEHDGKNPPITVADVLNEGDVPYGTISGLVEDEVEAKRLFDLLREKTPVLDTLESEYQSYQILLSSLKKLTGGAIRDYKGNREYAIASVVNTVYGGVTEEILARIEELTGENINKILAGQDKTVRTVYNVDQAKRLLWLLPNVDPDKYHISEEGTKWVASEGFATLFSKRYPKVTEEIIELLIKTIPEKLEWIPVKYESSSPRAQNRRYTVIKMYYAGKSTVDVLNVALAEYYSQE